MYRDPKKSRFRRFVPIAIVAVLGAVGLALWRVGPEPELTLNPSLPAVGPSTGIELLAEEPSRGLVGLRAELRQGDQTWPLAERSYAPRPFWAFWGPATFEDRWDLAVGKEHQEELVPGSATVVVIAERAGTWLRRPDPVELQLELPVHLKPPELVVDAVSPLVHQGGSGAVVYRVGEEAARHGLRIRDREIPGFSSADGMSRFLLFGVPHDLEGATEEMRLFAEDFLGNRTEQSFLLNYAEKTFKEDDIRLSDGFFNEVVPEILSHTPTLAEGESLLDTYLTINRDLRKTNAEALVKLSEKTRKEPLWQGRFQQLPNSRVMATFGDRRTYLYEGDPVDRQTHLGFDLASHRRAEVPSAQSGVVVLAEYFGIYGKTVVVDHGVGLMSLYSHLSDIAVEVGTEVEQGHVLGRTGATGLAGGDHLHFTVMIHGIQVSPLEWWDGRWIANRIDAVLQAPEQADRSANRI